MPNCPPIKKKILRETRTNVLRTKVWLNSKADAPETRKMGRQDHRHFPCKKTEAQKTVQMSYVRGSHLLSERARTQTKALVLFVFWSSMCSNLDNTIAGGGLLRLENPVDGCYKMKGSPTFILGLGTPPWILSPSFPSCDVVLLLPPHPRQP